jgi:RNA polymerase sigma-70 factor, ECF subfamily
VGEPQDEAGRFAHPPDPHAGATVTGARVGPEPFAVQASRAVLPSDRTAGFSWIPAGHQGSTPWTTLTYRSPAPRTQRLERAGLRAGRGGGQAGRRARAEATRRRHAELAGRRRHPDSPRSDNDLLARMQGGDVAAFGELYDRYCDRAYRVARGLSGDDARAENAVQEAFATVWRSRSSYRPDRPSAAAWLLAVVRNLAIDAARCEGPDDAALATDDPIDDDTARDDVTGAAVRPASAIEVRDVIGRLPVAQREVLVLSFYGELSQTEIAGELDVPLGTIQARLRHGLTALRHEFQENHA